MSTIERTNGSATQMWAAIDQEDDSEFRLYRLDPPMRSGPDTTTEYVIVHAYVKNGEPATDLLAADDQGKVLDPSELPGSLTGTLDHAAALADVGYDVYES